MNFTIFWYTQMQFRHLVDISECTFRDNDLLLRSMHEHVLYLELTNNQFRYYFLIKHGVGEQKQPF